MASLHFGFLQRTRFPLIPDPAHPNDVIALCWVISIRGWAAPSALELPGLHNQIFVIDFQAVPFFGIASGSNVTGQIHLYESEAELSSI